MDVEKSSFLHLGYMLTKDGIKSVQKKVQAVSDLQTPTALKQLRSFLGMVQFSRYRWKNRRHTTSTSRSGKGW